MTWISVKDRFPTEYREVIIQDDNDNICIASFNSDARFRNKKGPGWEVDDANCGFYGWLDDVKYWMPLPEPKKD